MKTTYIGVLLAGGRRVWPVLPSIAIAILITACATSKPKDVNPVAPASKKGYVDFYTSTPSDLSWDISRMNERTGRFVPLFSQYAPHHGILRIPVDPGHVRLRINIFNRIIEQPAEVDLEVREGMITAVRLDFSEEGTASFATKNVSGGGNAYGKFGKRIRIQAEEKITYTISAAAAAPIPYQRKEVMSYGR